MSQHNSDYLDIDDSILAFFDLTQLWDEFYTIPRLALPFRGLNEEEIREEFKILPKGGYFAYGFKGNYLAVDILRKLRATTPYKFGRIPRHSLVKMQDVPLDIILEIISYLHPIDLYSLIRTGQSLRHILLSTESLGVWKTVFARHEDIPAIPEGISPPRWVTTLFAPPRCDSCGIQPAMVHYTYFDRRCLYCVEYCSEAHALEMLGFTMTSEELRRYVRHTYTKHPHTPPFDVRHPSWYSVEHDTFPDPPVYRKGDIEIFLSQLLKYRRNITQSHPAAQDQLDEFLLTQAQVVEVQALVAKRNEHWSRDAYTAQYKTYYELQRTVLHSWTDRLKKGGINPLQLSTSYTALANIIEGNDIIKSDTKTFLKFQQQAREAVAHGKTFSLMVAMEGRTRDVKEFYHTEIVQKLPPSTWNNLPSDERVCAFPGVRRYIGSGGVKTSEWTDTTEFVQAIHRFIQCWFANSETLVLGALQSAGYDINESDVRSTVSIAGMSVFVCPYHEDMTFIGWDGIVPHIECSFDASGTPLTRPSSILTCSAAGNEIVSTLAKSIDRDALSTSIADLDAAAPIFVCADCLMTPLSDEADSEIGCIFFTWREAVYHGVIWDPSHRDFIPVSEETRRYILARHRPVMDPMQPVWGCNHCPRHARSRVGPVRRANVIKHLARIHGIEGPHFENDWIYMGGWQPEYPVFLSRQPSECFICMLCLPGRNFKLYAKVALDMHLNAKHDLVDPTENIHWKVLEVPDQ